ncbi:jg4166 [Pararge aegeria aegeria]|uniref:Jg4166 protein n=1 Tax=Pararge aegeria aegeria TaxID=348720 RepID=A0A8S4QXE2_9NEOP|nr:jg4166 [Pararge aegeria aegeria]
MRGGSAQRAMPASTYSPATFTHSDSQRAPQSQYSGLEPRALERPREIQLLAASIMGKTALFCRTKIESKSAALPHNQMP